MFETYDHPSILHPYGAKYPNLNNPKHRNEYMSKPSPRLEEDKIYWYFGDPILLPVEIEADLFLVEDNTWIPTPDWILNSDIEFIIKDFRGNALFKKTYENIESNLIDFTLTNEESQNIPKGTYTLHINVYKQDELIKRAVANSNLQIIVE